MLEIIDREVIIESHGVIVEVYVTITRINYLASDTQARCKTYGSQYLRVQYISCSTTEPICSTIGGNLEAFAACMLCWMSDFELRPSESHCPELDLSRHASHYCISYFCIEFFIISCSKIAFY